MFLSLKPMNISSDEDFFFFLKEAGLNRGEVKLQCRPAQASASQTGNSEASTAFGRSGRSL